MLLHGASLIFCFKRAAEAAASRRKSNMRRSRRESIRSGPLPALVTLLLQGLGEFLHEGLGIGRRGPVAGLARLGEARPSVIVDDPLGRDAVAESDRSTRHGSGVQVCLVDLDPDASGG